MQIISVLLALPVSIGLVIWVMRLKKDDPFSKSIVTRALLLGALASVLSAVFSIGLAFVKLLVMLGPGALSSVSLSDPQSLNALAEQIRDLSSGQDVSLIRIFINTFIIIGLIEELFKFLMLKITEKKIDTAASCYDMALLGALIGLGFQIFEDISYSGGGLVVAVFRAFMPFHFVFGAIMGYLYGKAKEEGKMWLSAAAILIPAIIHSIFDFSVNAYALDDRYLVLELVCIAAMLILFIASLIQIKKGTSNGRIQSRKE